MPMTTLARPGERTEELAARTVERRAITLLALSIRSPTGHACRTRMRTAEVGPVVLEIPPADEGSITGTVMDAWQRDLENVGPAGVDKGQGGQYLILPPGYPDKVPAGYIALASETPGSQPPPDGSVDIYFGPTAPAGKESNWVPTSADGVFEGLFRFYGPEKLPFEKTWRLPDIQKV